jgi:elongation factor Ts
LSIRKKEIAREQILSNEKDKNKPQNIIDNAIVESKVKKYFEDNCLLEQPYVKDPKKKISDLIEESIATMGENIVIRRFTRYQLGEEA